MTHRAGSGSQHNKNHMDKTTHYQPCLLVALISGHHNSRLQHVSLAPNHSSLAAEKPLQNLHTEESSHAPPTLLWQARGSHRVREPILFLMPALPAVSLFHLSAPICSTSWGGRTFRPSSWESSFALSTYSDASPVSEHPGGLLPGVLVTWSCWLAGPSLDFHNLIPGIAALISRTVEHILDHTAGLSSFSVKYRCHSSNNSFHTWSSW